MKGVRDWVFTQLLSKSWASSRSLSGGGSFFLNETVEEEPANDRARLSCSEAPPSSPPETSYSLNGNQDLGSRSSLQQVVEDSHHSDQRTHSEKKDATAKVEDLQVTFFRLLQRFGYSSDNPLVPKVLYRLHLAASIRAEGSDLKRLRKNRSRAIATEQEAAGVTELRFSIRILVLGKTGVGKSATINSIFDNIKTDTDAFQPATKEILEVVGTINGVKVTFIDTPGFLPSSTSNVRRNRKIMMSIRRYIRKSPPDIVLFFERLDLINMGYYELPLLMLMSEIFGSAIWFNTIIVLTHASPMIPEGPSGYPVNYESYVNQCADLMQFYVHQAVSDSKVEIPVLLVENHSQCRKNFKGESILPNGQAWQSQFFLLCICTKILGDASSLLHFEDSIKLGPLINPRVPSMPHLLSSFLRHQSAPKSNDTDPEIDEVLLTDIDEEDEYDQLPPIKMLTKSQFNRLTKSQKKEYLDELDYRETLYMKKHLREEARRRREEKLTDQGNSREDDRSEGQQAAPEAVLLPDMAVPPSFDSDCPQHRYRCLITSDQWLARPVLDPHGWDHDVGFDGINLETTAEISKDVHASISGQMNKDKNNFSIQSEFAAAFVDPKGPTYSVGVDVQSSGKDLICSAHSNAKLRTLKHNFMDCGVSLTSFGNKYYLGAKVEDTILCGKRLKFVVNAGQIRGAGKVAYGGSFATTLRGSDYPVKNDNVTLSMTALSFNKEMVLNGGLQSEFQPTRGMKMAVNVNLNSQKMGQVSIKLNSSEHLEIAVLAVFSIFNALFQRKSIKSKEVLETG